MFLLGIGIAAVLFIIGAPIFGALAVGGVVICLFYGGFPLSFIADVTFNQMNSFVLLAAPLFIFASSLIQISRASQDLVEFVEALLGHLPGGIATMAIAACTLFGAMTGSSTANTAAVGRIASPVMLSHGYDRKFTSGLLCCAGTLGNLIPPSVILILYAFLVDASVPKLFAAGLFPGLFLAGFFTIIAVVISKRRHFEVLPASNWSRRGKAFVKAIPVLMLAVVVLGGIYGGVFTATEAAGVACLYAVLLNIVIYRDFKWAKFWPAVKESARLIAILYAIVFGASLLSKMFIVAGVPQAFNDLVLIYGLTPVSFLILAVVMLLILGCFVDPLCITLVCVPLLWRPMVALGIDPIHFGVIFCTAQIIGQITPPVGIQYWFTSALLDTPADEVVRGAIPFLAAMVVFLFIVVFWPGLSLFLPGFVG